MSDPSLSAGAGTLIALCLLIAASVWLGTVAQRVVESGSFLKGYFLGNRGLGAWALALTATVQSGGTFMGFPSLVYSHGWTVALWISAYMVVPLTGFGVLGKRLAQISRRTNAITVPDLFRERFNSPAVGFVALSFILLFMSFMMVAQFKAGALIMKISWPGSGALSLAEDASGGFDTYYYVGLVIFAMTVIGYTLIGGFLAAVWTDLFQSVMMFIGVMILVTLAITAVTKLPAHDPAVSPLETATRLAVQNTGPGYVFGPGYAADGREFLPLGLAFSFFFVWVFAGLGSPAGTVRIMASKDTPTIRRSIFLLGAYNTFIYLPLIAVCICGRALMPDLPPRHSDEIIPRLALITTSQVDYIGSFLGGVILAAPFGAVMATVSSYLVVIASGLVRDLYQRLIHPAATRTEIRRLTYIVMIVIGCIAFAANISPVRYLQAIVVFSGASGAATFAMPGLMIAFWRRATAAGTIAGMVAGAGTMIVLYAVGFMLPDPMIGNATSFRPYFLLGLEPIVWGLLASLLAGIAVSLCTRPPAPELVSRLFDAQ
jgi:SSS family solute:Na+ symporter/sodium/pantothenate symporter